MNTELTDFRSSCREFAASCGQEPYGRHAPPYSDKDWQTLGRSHIISQFLLGDAEPRRKSVRLHQIIAEEFGPVGLDVPGVVAHNDAIANFLPRASEELRTKWRNALLDGSAVAAIAVSDPSSGSYTSNLSTALSERPGGGWELTGRKVWITNGPTARLVFVLADHRDGPLAGRSSVVAVDMEDKGAIADEPRHTAGLHATRVGDVSFERVRVRESDVVGRPGSGRLVLMQAMTRERLSVGVVATASSRMVLTAVTDWAKNRNVAGGTLSSRQAVYHRLAELAAQQAAVEALAESCHSAFDEGSLSSQAASQLKLLATETQFEIADYAGRLYGATGYEESSFITRELEHARVQRIYAGTSEIMKEIIAYAMGMGDSSAPGKR